MRDSIKRPAVAACLLMAVAGCGQTPAPAGTTVQASSLVATAIEKAPAVPRPTTLVPASPARVAPPQQWVMPDLAGHTLQQAQDGMQKLTGNPVFITRSHDATGKKRNQVVDSNWKVCSQNIAPGGQVTEQSTVDFATVKLDESCP